MERSFKELRNQEEALRKKSRAENFRGLGTDAYVSIPTVNVHTYGTSWQRFESGSVRMDLHPESGCVTVGHVLGESISF
jgi:hypothetical protein